MPIILAFNVEFRFQGAMYAVIPQTVWFAHQAISPCLVLVKVAKLILQAASNAMFWVPHALCVIMDMHYLRQILPAFLAPLLFQTVKTVYRVPSAKLAMLATL